MSLLFFEKERTMQPTLFKDIALSEEILRAIEDIGYTEMTQIQKEAIPFILDGRDVTGRSNTGTGKTAAFGIPAVESLEEDASNRAKVLVLSPTRELALQISEEIKKFAKHKKNISIATIYGGQSMQPQIHQLKKANIVIGTPGRIMDHMRRRTLRLDHLRMVILDEADEMLNMGFYEDIKHILSESPKERQTILFSATMPKTILKITREFQNDPKLIEIESQQKTVANIEQSAYMVPHNKKTDALYLLLSYHQPKRALIFCNTKKMVDDLVDRLNDNGYRSVGLHGDMKQNLRTKVMTDYKNAKIKILVATDVAARGIDVTDIDAVFNYDVPQELEYYIHRIGRTARAGKEGNAYTLMTNKTQLRKVQEIQRIVKAQIDFEELPSSKVIYKKNKSKFAEKLKTSIDKNEHKDWEPFIDELVQEGYSGSSIAAALLGMLDEKDKTIMPKIKDITSKYDSANNKERRFNHNDSFSKSIVEVNIGRNEDVSPNHIVGAIVEATGISSKAIGKIQIYQNHTTVEMLTENSKLVLDVMQNTRIKNKKVNFKISTDKPSDNHPKKNTKRKKNYGRRGNSKYSRTR